MFAIAMKSAILSWTQKPRDQRIADARALANAIIDSGAAEDIRNHASPDVADSFDRFLFALLEWK